MITFTIDIKIHTDPHNNPTTRVLLLPAVAVWLLLLHLVPPTHKMMPDKYNLRSYQVQTFKPQQPIHQNKDPQINCPGKNLLPHSCGDLRDYQENPSAGELRCISQGVGTGVQGYRGTGAQGVMMWVQGGVQRYRSVMMWCPD